MAGKEVGSLPVHFHVESVGKETNMHFNQTALDESIIRASTDHLMQEIWGHEWEDNKVDSSTMNRETGQTEAQQIQKNTLILNYNASFKTNYESAGIAVIGLQTTVCGQLDNYGVIWPSCARPWPFKKLAEWRK